MCIQFFYRVYRKTVYTKKFVGKHQVVIRTIEKHLTELYNNFSEYFPDDDQVKQEDWIRNPFILTVDKIPENFTNQEKSELIGLICDKYSQDVYNNEELINFWLRLREIYPLLSDRAVKFLIKYTTSYLCEVGFSHMLYIKKKYRSAIKDLAKKSWEALL